MKLEMICFRGDDVWDRRIKEESNYTDNAHIYTATYAVCQLVLAELSPLELDGNPDFSVCLNIDRERQGRPGYNWSRGPALSYSFYNLGEEVSRSFYRFRRFDREFQRYAAGVLLDALAEADQAQGGRGRIGERRAAVLERLEAEDWRKKLPVEKYCKASRDRKYQAMVYRCISQQVGEAIRGELVRRADGQTVAARWMTDLPGYVLRTPHIKRAWWEEGRFCLAMFDKNAAPITLNLPCGGG